MKQRTLQRFAPALLLLAAMLVGCTKEQIGGKQLPDGKYPMTFTATVEKPTASTEGPSPSKPASRATPDGSWDGGEELALMIDAEVKKHIAATDGVLSVAGGVTPWYWQNTTDIKIVSAWYPFSVTKPTSFIVKKDQTRDANHQTSDCLYSDKISVSFKGTHALLFKHLSVKMVVNLKHGDGVTQDDIKGATVSVVNQTLTSGAIDATWKVAQITTAGSDEIITNVLKTASSGYQKTVQALVVPQQMQGHKFIKVTCAEYGYYYIPVEMTDANLQSGNQYTYNITVNKNGLAVTTSGAIPWTGDNQDVASEVPVVGAADLKIGDYYYSDSKTSDGGYRKYKNNSTTILPIMPVLIDADGNSRKVIGIVMKVGRDKSGNWADDCQYKQKDGETDMTDITGYVLALNEANSANTCSWGSMVTTSTNTEQIGFYGYKNTNTIKSFNTLKDGTLRANFPATYWATVGYETMYSAPAKSSGWFLPSAGQCQYWFDNRDLLLVSMRKVKGNGYQWKACYWSSSEDHFNPARNARYLSLDSGLEGINPKSDLSSYVRSVLAF